MKNINSQLANEKVTISIPKVNTNIANQPEKIAELLNRYFAGEKIEPELKIEQWEDTTVDENIKLELSIQTITAIKMLMFDTRVSGTLRELRSFPESINTVARFILTGEDVHKDFEYYVGGGYRGYITHQGTDLI